jgi:D-alanine-D-alanine ligase
MSNRPDDQDTLHQAKEIEGSLKRLGCKTRLLGIGSDLTILEDSVFEMNPDIIFNGVEEYMGSVSQSFQIPRYLETLDVPFTGSGSKAMSLCASKIQSKQMLIKAHLATPDYITQEASAPDQNSDIVYIIKSSDEHASLGIDSQSIVKGVGRAKALIAEKITFYSGEWFAEQFIDGREFNVAIIGSKQKPEVLPINEIVFENFPKDVPKIVDYDAKWNPNSFGYHHTVRKTLAPFEEALLQAQLKEMAMQCWHLFELNGYARVDFRVDEQGKPWILEINSNPCLSADAGFMASCVASGMTLDSAILKILDHCENES